MTPAGATVFVLFDRPAFAADVPTLAPEVSLMTGGTEGRVAGRGPCERGRHTAAVAIETSGVSSVVARVITLKVMAEDRRLPGIGGMARIALHSGVQVISGFGCCAAARIVVTLIASTSAAVIVSPRAADEGGGGMAEVAVRTC